MPIVIAAQGQGDDADRITYQMPSMPIPDAGVRAAYPVAK